MLVIPRPVNRRGNDGLSRGFLNVQMEIFKFYDPFKKIFEINFLETFICVRRICCVETVCDELSGEIEECENIECF